jgi:membrane associated rhomboid family serine protease
MFSECAKSAHNPGMSRDEWRLLRYGLLTALLMGLILVPILARNIYFPKVAAEAILAAIAGAVFLLSEYRQRKKNFSAPPVSEPRNSQNPHKSPRVR